MSELTLTPRFGIVGLVIHWPKAGRPDASVRAGEARYRREEAAEIEADAYHAALLEGGSDSDFLAATFVFEDAPSGRRLVSLRTSPNPDPFERRCRVCGCTEDHACEGGCWWVAADLCSSCAAAASAADLTPEEEAGVLAAVAEVQAQIKLERLQSGRCQRCGAEFPVGAAADPQGQPWFVDHGRLYCPDHLPPSLLSLLDDEGGTGVPPVDPGQDIGGTPMPLTAADEAARWDDHDSSCEAPEPDEYLANTADPTPEAALAADSDGAGGELVGAVAAELVSALDLATVPDGELR